MKMMMMMIMMMMMMTTMSFCIPFLIPCNTDIAVTSATHDHLQQGHHHHFRYQQVESWILNETKTVIVKKPVVVPFATTDKILRLLRQTGSSLVCEEFWRKIDEPFLASTFFPSGIHLARTSFTLKARNSLQWLNKLRRLWTRVPSQVARELVSLIGFHIMHG